MEREQLRTLRAGFDSWNRGEFEETLQYMREDVVWRPGGFFTGLDPVYEGHAGMRRFFGDFAEPWEEISIELERVLEESDRLLFVVARFRARGREGIEVDAPFFQLYRFDDAGLVSEFEAYPDEAEARRATKA